MRTKRLLTAACLATGCLLTTALARAQEAAAVAAPAAITLPAPVTSGGKPLLDLLKVRHSTREFGAEAVPPQTLSNLLWAAWGVNRADGRRTAPSASNRQEIEIYVTLPDGAFRWNAPANRLEPVAAGDHRAAAGTQPFVATAPLNLVYVADMAKLNRPAGDPQQMVNVGADAGFIAQNVYLFCASEGLVTVVRAMVDRPKLAQALELRETQVIVLAQTVGYPKK